MTKKTTKQAALEQLTSRLISATEAARISGFTTGYIRRLLIEGQIEGVKVGRNWLTTEEAIREYLSRKRRRGRPKRSRQD